jgi:outer membrane lipoprotein-sorting protein
MYKIFQTFFIIICLQFTVVSFRSKAQEFNPQPLLDSVKNKFNKVNDYTADIKIKVNVSFIKIPVKEGKLYFKKPDKVKLVSKGFAMLPKRGMNFTFNELFEKKYNAIFVKNEIINKLNTYVIKIIPLDDLSDILLATIWIDRKTQTIRKIDAVSKSNGNFVTLFDYPIKANPFDLPSQLTFTFEVTKANLPMGVTGDFGSDKPKVKDNKPQKATLNIIYANYNVNKGIADSFFRDEKTQP